jgi:hypothetical protein
MVAGGARDKDDINPNTSVPMAKPINTDKV